MPVYIVVIYPYLEMDGREPPPGILEAERSVERALVHIEDAGQAAGGLVHGYVEVRDGLACFLVI